MGLYIKSNDLFMKNQVSLPPGPLVVGVEIENELNMGAIIRLACNFGCPAVRFVYQQIPGIKIARVNRTAHSSSHSVDWKLVNYSFLTELQHKMSLIAIETTKNAVNIADTVFPETCALLVGSEIHGIPEEILAMCSHSVYIPMSGSNKSLNVSHALGIGLYEWLRQRLSG